MMLDGRLVLPSAIFDRLAKALGLRELAPTALLEALERRRLLSAAGGAAAESGMIARPLNSIAAAATGNGGVPLGSATVVGYTPAQIDGAYGINAIQFGSTVGNGAGQTIAIIVAYDNPNLVDTGAAGFATSDLHEFDMAMGLADPPSFLKVDQSGGVNYPGTDPSGGWENESAMDVEWAHATAPAANILLVEANSADLTDLIGGAVVYAAQQSGVSVVSMSFATPEAAEETSFDPDLTTPAGHAGVTFVAGTGDYGVPGDYPAFSPNVVAVGATTLLFDDAGGYAGESGFAESGGGISQYEPKPAYQDLVTTPSSTYRTIPDVAFDGDDTSGGAVYDAYNGGSSNPWYEVGGTSFGTPNWSGQIAIADQGRALAGLSPLDGPSQTLPRLYGLPAATFHDVTTGSNSGSDGAGYNATVGYDLVTGRGTPVANLLVPALAGGTGSIAGSVFVDAAGDGVRTVNDKPLAGWTVNLADDGVILATVSTASNGAFSFAQLPAGTFVASVVVASGYRQTLPAADSYTLMVGNGQTLTAITFAAKVSTAGSPAVSPASSLAMTTTEPVPVAALISPAPGGDASLLETQRARAVGAVGKLAAAPAAATSSAAPALISTAAPAGSLQALLDWMDGLAFVG